MSIRLVLSKKQFKKDIFSSSFYVVFLAKRKIN